MSVTHQQKLEAIREACISVNPSIKDLVFGCCLRRKENGANSVVYKERYDGTLMIADWDGWHEKQWITSEFEIIGRPIQLADVLHLFGRYTSKGMYTVEPVSCGLIRIKRDGSWTYVRPFIEWNPLCPLHFQEPEVIDFIYELIK